MRYIERDVQFNYAAIARSKKHVFFCYFYTSNISLPRSYLLETGGFDEDFKHAVWEDVEIGYRLWMAGVRIVYEPRARVFHHHRVTLEDYLKRQYRLGLMGSLLYRKHPELCELVPVTETVNPEIQHRFYHAILDYYYFMGIQRGLMSEGELPDSVKNIPVIPFEERLENWNTLWLGKLHQRLFEARLRIKELEEIVRDKDFILKVGNEEITRRDRLTAEREAEITRLNHTLREKDRELTELRWFEGRVKRTMPYKAYKIMKSILQGGH